MTDLRAIGYLLLLVATGITWGLTVSLATVATSGGHHPISVTLWSLIVGFLVLSAGTALRRRRPPFDRRHLTFYAIAGLLGTALPHALSFYAALHVPAGPRAIIFATIPLVVLALSVFLGVEKIEVRRFAGIALGFLGIVILFAPALDGSMGGIFWLLIALGAAISYAVENVYISLKQPEGLDTMTALWGMSLAAIAMLAPVALAVDPGFFEISLTGRAEMAMALVALVHLAAYAGFLVLIRGAGAVFASQVSYIVTPAGILWGVVLLSEEITLIVAASTALVLLGLALIKPNADRKVRAEAQNRP